MHTFPPNCHSHGKNLFPKPFLEALHADFHKLKEIFPLLENKSDSFTAYFNGLENQVVEMEKHVEVIESEIIDPKKMEAEHKSTANCNQIFCSKKG